jgi:hypothetical protein
MNSVTPASQCFFKFSWFPSTTAILHSRCFGRKYKQQHDEEITTARSKMPGCGWLALGKHLAANEDQA